MGVGGVLETFEHDDLVQNEAFDAVEVANRIGVQDGVAESKKLTTDEGVTTVDVCRRAIDPFQSHSGPLNERTNAGTKTGGSRVGGPKLSISDQWVTRDGGDISFPGSGPFEEVKPYVLF